MKRFTGEEKKLRVMVRSAIALCWLPSILLAARTETTEIESLRAELQELKQRYETQRQQIQALAQRLQELTPPQSIRLPPPPVPSSPRGAVTQAEERTPNPAPQPAVGTDEEDRVKAPQPTRGTEVAIREEHTLFTRRFTFEPGISYSRFDRSEVNLSGFLALDAIFLGLISVDAVGSDVVTLDLTARYGLTDRLQADINVPFLYRNTSFESAGVQQGSTRLSDTNITLDPEIGDVNFGFFYQLFLENSPWPEVVLNARVKAPTGLHPYGVNLIQPDPDNGNLIVPQELPSGNGVWTVSPGFSFLKTADPVVLYANFSYFHNFTRGFDDISSENVTLEPDTNTPGDIDLGNSYQYGLGMALALNERTSLSLSIAQRLVEHTFTESGGQRTEQVGTDANIVTMSFGLTYALSDRLAWLTNVGIGLTRDAPDVTLSMKLPYSF